MKFIQISKSIIKKIQNQLTFLDYVIFLVILIACALLFIFFRRENVFIDIQVKVTDSDVQYINVHPQNEYAVNFRVGDKEINELGLTTAEITRVESYHTEPEKVVVYLTMHVRANYNPRTKQYSLKGIPIAIGQSLTFTLTQIKFNGIVIGFPGVSQPAMTAKKIILKAQLRDTTNNRQYSDTYGVPLFIAQAVKTGDVIKDSQGRVIVRVLNVDVSPAKRTIITKENTSLTILDQELKDVFYTLEIQGLSKNGSLYAYDYLPLFIGQMLPLNFPYITVKPTITEID